jgi:hypothetical protein
MTKPIYVGFSYSLRPSVDRANLTILMPAGSGNEAIMVNGIAASANVINLLAPAGAAFAPGFSMALAGSAKKAILTLDWISVWQ